MAARAERRPRAGASGRATLMTVLGELVLTGDGTAWTATLVEVLASLGVAEKNARQAIARLADQGFIAKEPAGRRVRWHLSAEGRDLLTTGTERIYGFLDHAAAWDGRW
ncbi:MAG: PaaX family transcriptional regulator C-terminal domain-containing protein, partial [Acidimicrobiales bacterium]